jgi:hypothetical protein
VLTSITIKIEYDYMSLALIMTLSFDGDSLSKFLSDRVRFKLYACQRRLKNLKNIESKYGNLASADVRLSAEIEVDCLLSQMIGTVDSLLIEINDKLELGISIDKVEMVTVLSGLLAKTNKIELLEDLDNASQYGNWYWLVKQLRNYSFHSSLILMPANSTRLYLPRMPTSSVNDSTSIELIPYLEQSLNKLKKLIENIRMKEEHIP